MGSIESLVGQPFPYRIAIAKGQVEPTSFPKGRTLRPPPASSVHASRMPLAVYCYLSVFIIFLPYSINLARGRLWKPRRRDSPWTWTPPSRGG